MIELQRFLPSLPGRDVDPSLSEEPTKDEIRTIVKRYKADGLCGRRIAEDHLGPYFIASDRYGDRELDLLEEVIEEVYAGTGLCIQKRSSKCKRWRGGCQNRQ